MWKDFFAAGGSGMYPTSVFGFALVAACLLYALRPEQRLLRVALTLGVVTLAAGLLGALTGIVTSAHFLPQVAKADQLEVFALGLGESLHDVVLALLLIVVGGLAASVGAWRQADAPKAA